MINLKIHPFLASKEYAVKLEDFEPKGGVEPFLKEVCPFLGATFLDWYQGIEFGIGHIVYNGYKMIVSWSDFPFALSFDCENESMAHQMHEELEKYFHLNEERWASAWKHY